VCNFWFLSGISELAIGDGVRFESEYYFELSFFRFIEYAIENISNIFPNFY
jgi:hypothetical protein